MRDARRGRVWWLCRGGDDRPRGDGAVDNGHLIVLEVEPLMLDLRTPFGTSHSSTSRRVNALVRFTIIGTRRGAEGGDAAPGEREGRSGRDHIVTGLAEVGLPPKKPGVYEAEYDDVYCFVVHTMGPSLAARLGTRCNAWGIGAGGLGPGGGPGGCEGGRRGDDAEPTDGATISAAEAGVATEEELKEEGVNVLEGLPEWCFPVVRHGIAANHFRWREDDAYHAMFIAALEAIDVTRRRSVAATRAGVEVAVLDAWAKLVDIPLRQFIGFYMRQGAAGPPSHSRAPSPQPYFPSLKPTALPPPRASYYTVALDDDMGAVVENARWGQQFTPYLKIKVDSNLHRAAGIFTALRDANLIDSSGGHRHVCVDANAAWTPEVARQALGPDMLGPFLPCIAVLEQPFPVDLPWTAGHVLIDRWHEQGNKRGVDAGELSDTDAMDARNASDERCGAQGLIEAWAKVVAAWHATGIVVIADESVRDATDVAAVASCKVAHGVNLKMEKAGGIRGMLAAAEEAANTGLLVWLGIMVATRLNCAATASLLELTPGEGGAFCDLDGNLLVAESSQRRFVGGIGWCEGSEGVVILPDAPGHGVMEREEHGCSLCE